MAYAGTQDQRLQLRVFAVEAKKYHEPHKAWNIRFAYQSQQMTTSDQLFILVVAKRFEKQGGQYEADLFGPDKQYGSSEERRVGNECLGMVCYGVTALREKKIDKRR